MLNKPGERLIDWARSDGLLVALCVSVGVLFAYHTALFGLDDSYITYRYADNLEHGLGLVFNSGEPYLGTTAPGFALWLALLHSLVNLLNGPAVLAVFSGLSYNDAVQFLDIPHLARYTSALSLVGIAFVASSALKQSLNGKVGVWLNIIAVLWLLTYPPLALVAGHETLTQIFLVMLALSKSQSRPVAGGLLFGLAALVRPDALIAMVPAGMALLAQDVHGRVDIRHLWNSKLVKMSAIFSLAVLPWILFATWFYGSPIPGTLQAKQSQVLYGFWPTANVWNIVATALDGVPAAMRPPMCGLVLLGAGVGVARAPKLRPFIWWGILYLVAYHSLQVTLWPWYSSPIAVLVPILAVYGAWNVYQFALTRFDRQRFVYGAALAAIVGMLGISACTSAVAAFGSQLYSRHIYTFEPVARYIETVHPEGASVACLEPGALSWYLGPKYKVIDALGLTSPGVAAHRSKGDTTWVYLSNQPDYIYFYNDSMQPVRNTVWFQLNYHMVARFPDAWWEAYGNQGPQLWEHSGTWQPGPYNDTAEAP